MKNFDVINNLTIYEIDGKEVTPMVGNKEAILKVENHWNDSNLIVLKFKDYNIAVRSDDLKNAIGNIKNAFKF